MKIAVIGLWHLGTVTAACLSSVGYNVIAYDPNADVITKLKNGCPPIFEPQLENLLHTTKLTGKLVYSNNVCDIAEATIIWITFDTPVDNHDVADVNYVISQVSALYEYIQNDALVLISSQIPVGTTRTIQEIFTKKNNKNIKKEYNKNICFAYIPENLRLGKAIDVFMNPARIIVGLDNKNYTEKIETLLKPFCQNVIWMSVVSAEMTKHAINTFLAISVTFINELASLCELVGANGYEVEQGLKSEERIGQKAYLHPGDAIAGGTLMRDINFLIQLGAQQKQNTNLISAVISSNRAHQQWTRQKLLNIFNDLSGKKIAMLGLTYKANTNTLRRSSAMETCEWLFQQGCEITAFDPSITHFPNELSEFQFIQLKDSYQNAIATADAIVIATAWPQFCMLTAEELEIAQKLENHSHKKITIIDPSGCVAKNMRNSLKINYYSVGDSLCNPQCVPQSSQGQVRV